MHRLVRVTLLFLILALAAVHATSAPAKFSLGFGGLLHHEDWSYLSSVASNGPYFVDDYHFVLFDSTKTVTKYDLLESAPIALTTPGNEVTALFKGDGGVYLRAGEGLFRFTGAGFADPVTAPLAIGTGALFDLLQGLSDVTEPSRQIYPVDGDHSFAGDSFVTMPRSLGSDVAFFVARNASDPYSTPYRLMRYDATLKSVRVLRDDVYTYCPIPDHLDLLLAVVNTATCSLVPNMEWAPAFAIIDASTGDIVQAFDQSDCAAGRQFAITSIDINSKGEIAAIGTYWNFAETNGPYIKQGMLELFLRQEE